MRLGGLSSLAAAFVVSAGCAAAAAAGRTSAIGLAAGTALASAICAAERSGSALACSGSARELAAPAACAGLTATVASAASERRGCADSSFAPAANLMRAACSTAGPDRTSFSSLSFDPATAFADESIGLMRVGGDASGADLVRGIVSGSRARSGCASANELASLLTRTRFTATSTSCRSASVFTRRVGGRRSRLIFGGRNLTRERLSFFASARFANSRDSISFAFAFSSAGSTLKFDSAMLFGEASAGFRSGIAIGLTSDRTLAISGVESSVFICSRRASASFSLASEFASTLICIGSPAFSVSVRPIIQRLKKTRSKMCAPTDPSIHFANRLASGSLATRMNHVTSQTSAATPPMSPSSHHLISLRKDKVEPRMTASATGSTSRASVW